MSKAILGGTLTSQAYGKSSTNALGNIHNEVRQEVRDADLRQLAACGMRIPLDWAHKKMQIQQAEPDEPQLVAATSASKPLADKGEG